MRQSRRWVLLASLTLTACSPTRGCIESNFDLAAESRLPKWFASAGVARANASVTMDYWGGPVGRTATSTLRDARGRKIASVIGQLQGKAPLTLEPHGATGPLPYPLYEIIVANGITEVIEHRERGSIFHITDDPEVRRKLGVSAPQILK